MDKDLLSIHQARELLRNASKAQHEYKTFEQADVDRIVEAMARAGEAAAESLGRLAHEETGFGKAESKTQKNLFATRTLLSRMEGMRTCGIINKTADGKIWEVATPMGIVAALVPSTNPTSTAMYKAIISAKARCGVVMSPHPRAAKCTAAALRVVAEAAYAAGAPEGLFGCMTEVTLEGTDALLEDPLTDVILATGGGPMVRAAYSKGKPAYGVGSGNVPAYVDRSANLAKAAADILTGTSFDWGTLCSTERTVVADAPIKKRLIEEFQRRGGHVCTSEEAAKLRKTVAGPYGGLNVDIVGQSPARIAQMSGFSVPDGTKALIAEVTEVGKGEPLSMETLSPILSLYSEDGWESGCKRCIEVLEFGGIGHTLAIHAGTERVIEQFALKKPAMRIVVNTVAALGSVGMTTPLFPSMTLGPGTVGGSITSDNITPLHLLNVKRLAFETNPLNSETGEPLQPSEKARPASPSSSRPAPTKRGESSWIDEIERRLREGAGNPKVQESRPRSATPEARPSSAAAPTTASVLPLPDPQIEALIQKHRR
ncbi:acetaldehyde dehydrogenase (acetylating) [soil metagenome]